MKKINVLSLSFVFFIFILAMSCQPVSQESLAGNWKPDLTGLEAKLEAELDKKKEEASDLEKIALGLGKGMVPKIIKSLEEMRLVLNADSSYSMEMPKLLGKKSVAKNGKWQLSEDKSRIILNVGLGEEQTIKIVDANTIILETKDDKKDNPLKEITLKREE